MWPFLYLGSKIVDFWTPGQTGGCEGIRQNASRAGRNLDILASWHQLGCLAAGLAPPPHCILAPALPLSCFDGFFGYQIIDILVAVAP